jgi:hypothetical protein
MTELIKLPTVAAPPCQRAGCTPMDDDECEELDELVTLHGFIRVAHAADCSVQSVAKAIARRPLFESTKRRLRSILRKKVV